jgi:hypothetical protein
MDATQAGPERARSRRTRMLGRVLLALPAVVVLVWCVLLRPEPASLLAPLLGPWAGVLYGHWECTLASAHPWRIAAGSAGVIAAVALGWRRPGLVRGLAGVLLVCSGLAWLAAALLSVANTAF